MSRDAASRPSPATPKAEVHIDADLVRALLRAQHRDLAHLPIEPIASGWDNAMFRLGTDMTVRLPRRAASASLLENEQRWLPTFAPRLPLPAPAPIRIGTRHTEYPWNWSVLPWLMGVAADQSEPQSSEAGVLANFLKALHVPAPAHAPRNPYRGVPLVERATVVEQRMARLEGSAHSISRHIRCLWEEALAAPLDVTLDVGATWLHGDLHARNVLVHEGRLSAIIDWGDMCQGDCATDLAAIWMLLPTAASRAQAMSTYTSATPATWQRARGWAVLFGTTLLETGLTDTPRHAAMGALTLQRLQEGP